MAQLYPDISQILHFNPMPTSSLIKVWTLLTKILDDSFEIFFRPFLNSDKPDIVILHKTNGVLIVQFQEINLKEFYFDYNFRLVSRYSDAKVISAVNQCLNIKNNLQTIYCPLLMDKIKIDPLANKIIKSLCVFVNSNKSDKDQFFNPPENNLDIHRIQNLNKTENLAIAGDEICNENNLIKCIESLNFTKIESSFSSQLYLELRNFIFPPIMEYRYFPEITYSAKQLLIINDNSKFLLVKGVSGSGKSSIIAKKAIVSNLESNTRVLILTYNLSQCNYLRHLISRIIQCFSWSNFEINSFNEFFKSKSYLYGLDIVSLEDLYSIDHFCSVTQLIERYNYIFVDNVHEYPQVWIDILQKYFLSDHGHFFAIGSALNSFCDRDTFFVEDSATHFRNNKLSKLSSQKINAINKSEILLTENYRSTVVIDLFCSYYYNYFLRNDIKINDHEYNPPAHVYNAFDNIKYYFIDENIDISSFLIKIYREFMRTSNITSDEVAILAPTSEILRYIERHLRLFHNEKTMINFETEEEYNIIVEKYLGHGGYDITDEAYLHFNDALNDIRRPLKARFDTSNSGIKLSTIQNFSDWDRNTIFLIIFNLGDHYHMRPFLPELIYTGLTRARSNLFIINFGLIEFHKFFKKLLPNSFISNKL